MSGYIGNIPVPQATQTRQTFTATASQTTFNTAGYSPGYIDVFLNGVKLAPADYTATNGSDVVLAVGAASGDILETVAYEIFQVLDQDFIGDFTVDGSTFVVDSTNNRVGIGTSSPSTTIEAVGSVDILQLTGTTGNAFARFTDSDASSDFSIGADDGVGSGSFIVYDRNNTAYRMVIDSSGNVGIGTTSPSAYGAGYTTVGVNGSSMSGVEGFVNGTLTSYTQTYAAQTLVGTKTATPLIFVTNDTQRMRIDSSGNVGIGSTAPGMLLEVDASNGSANDIARFSGRNSGGLTFRNATSNEFIMHTATSDALIFGTNGNTERMRIDSSGNVGIGTSSPSQSWTGGTARTFQVQGPSSTITVLRVNEASDTYGDLQLISGASNEVALYNFNNGAMRFGTNGAERMRIDSSGNVLVGKTTIGTGTAGIALRSNGEVRGTADGDYAARFSRLTSDGAIVGFEKDGSVVGTIGTVSSELFIGTGSSGFYFDASNTSIKPRNVSSGTGSAADGTIDLGGTGNRFKDLYLSGGILADGISSVSTIREKVTVTLTTSGTINADLLSGAVVYFSANQLANRTINFRGDGSNTLNSIMDAGQSVTFAALMAQGSTAYYLNAYQVDGTSVTPKWSGGSAPTGGNPSSIDVYTFTIIKTASATFTVLASLTQYA